MIENGTLLQNRYLIEKKIGTGGMGAVYLAVDKRFDNHVAIKETFYNTDEFGEAFEREARLLNALQHPVLPHVTDYFAEQDGYFLVMQYIEGEDLSDILKRDGRFEIADVLRWTDSLLDALEYLHSQEPPVIHRDIKPHNLKLNLRGGIMLLDFGLAKLNRKDASEVSVFGYSRTYSPLEQIQGTGTDAHSDIFALGATVYHLLTGTPPINALTRAAAIVGGNTDPLRPANELRPEIPAPVANIINSALALNSQNRFISAKAMRQALEHAAAAEDLKNNDSKTALAAGGLSPRIHDAAQADEKFPALEAFANAKTNGTETPGTTEENVENDHRASISNSSPIIVDVAARVPVKREVVQKRIVWAAAAVLLFFGIAAAFYFSSRGNSADQTKQSAVNANSSGVNSNRASVAETKTKQASDKSAEKSKSDDSKPDAEGKVSNPPPEQTENQPAKRRNPASGNDEIVTDEELPAESVDESETVVESRDEKPEQRPRQREKPIPDVMTEEEFEKIKREEKQRRRQRSNRPNSEYYEPE